MGVTSNDIRLVLPPVLYAAPGCQTNIYFDNVMLSLEWRQFAYEVICAKGTRGRDCWPFIPSAGDTGDHELELVVRNSHNRVVAAGRTLLRVAGDILVRDEPLRLMLIGDSLTSEGIYPRRLLELSRAGGVPLTLVGSQLAASANGEFGHEGHAGWRAESFVKLNDGDFEGFYAKVSAGRPADVVAIFLGTNDVFLERDETIDSSLSTILRHYDVLIQSIHRVPRADTRIGVVLTTPPSNSQDGFRSYRGVEYQMRWQYRRNQHRAVERLIEHHFSRREMDLIDLIPAYLNLDTAHHFPTAEEPLCEGSSRMVTRVINGVHPSPEGYRQIGDSIYCWLRAIAAAR